MNSIPYAPVATSVVTGTTGSCYPTTNSYAAPVAPY
jgi:hypothetical protein